jgi:hypothetical protein
VTEVELDHMSTNAKVTVNSVDLDKKKANVLIEITIDGATKPIKSIDNLDLDIGDSTKFASIWHEFRPKQEQE